MMEAISNSHSNSAFTRSGASSWGQWPAPSIGTNSSDGEQPTNCCDRAKGIIRSRVPHSSNTGKGNTLNSRRIGGANRLPAIDRIMRAKVRAALGEDGSFAFVYSPRGEAFTVRMDAIKSRAGVKSWWFDPRYGSASPIHTGENISLQTFTPPGQGRGQDWLLVLDDAGRRFPPPGQK